MQDYSFVVDEENKPLAPTKVNKAWFLVRKGRAELVSKYPMVIRLRRKIDNPSGEFVMGSATGYKVTEATAKASAIYRELRATGSSLMELMSEKMMISNG